MHVEVNDPREKQVLSRAYGSQGRVSLTIFYNVKSGIQNKTLFSLHLPRICLASTEFA